MTSELSIEQSLSLLNPEQHQAVVHEGSPLLILAGAGSGKTRVITTKIAYLISEKGVDPRSILAVTFTKKAAREMKERAVAMCPNAEESQIRTFHSFGAFFLRRYAGEAGIDKNFTVYDDDDMVTLIQMSTPGLKKNEAASYAHRISLAKDYCLSPDSDRLSEISNDPIFAEVYSAYEKKLRATGNVDFGDLIMLPVFVLESNQNVRRQMHYRYRVIMVDEYQDSNVAQFKLLKALSGVDEESGTYVCVVGDDDQSIYKFRGAEVQNILSFQKEFPGTKLIRLERNYRSTASILNAAGKVVSKNQGRLGKTLVAERGDGKKPDLIFLPNQDDEAAFCAELILKAKKKGEPFNSWAILYRTNAQSLGFESEFLRKKIPYQVVGSLKFYEREEIKDLLSFLALIANPKDEIAFRRIVNKPARGVGPSTQEKIIAAAASDYMPLSAGPKDDSSSGEKSTGLKNLVQTAAECAPSLSKKAREGVEKFSSLMTGLVEKINALRPENSSLKLSDFVNEIIEKSGLEEYHAADDEISGTQRVLNMQELANNAALYPFSMEGLLEFLDTIELDRTLLSEEEGSQIDSVTLITLHNTKGLEFPRVIITGLENGVFPRANKDAAELEEERRLFYVGITRAKDELYVTSCAQRRLYGRTEFMEPSVFLAEAGGDVFRVLGAVPASYEYAVFGAENSSGSEDGLYEGGGYARPAAQVGHPLAKKYPVGQNVFHDDYGYGQVVKAFMHEGEYVVSVAFQNGGIKKFLPQYQSGQLMRVDENF